MLKHGTVPPTFVASLPDDVVTAVGVREVLQCPFGTPYWVF